MAFTRELFAFLRDLEKNNEKAWFDANSARYEKHVRDPGLDFVAAVASPLAGLGPGYRADPRPVGGSMFRIHRDTRFSKDKTPYKTNVAFRFPHRGAAKDETAPGVYLSLAVDGCWAGGGVWHPDPEPLSRIRDAVAARPDAWRKAVKGLELEGESLKRVPRGFDPEHPLAEDLKRKDFISSVELAQKDVLAPGFEKKFLAACKRIEPLNAFLGEALGTRGGGGK